MVEDTHDGSFFAVPPNGGGHVRPNSGPVGIGLFDYSLSEQSLRVRERADAVMKRIVERKGLGRFLKLTETPGVYASHPLGGCRMAESIDLGVTDHRCEAYGAEGLFCMDSSAIPTSLGVNPSLTIAAVCERAAAALVRRADDFGLPRRSKGFRHRPPGVHLGKRFRP
jgi:choline dehydrogenase-like flavoprotein